MRIEIDINESYDDTSVRIQAPALSKDIEKIVSMMRMLNMQLAVRRQDEIVLLDTDQVLYVEAVDRNTFVYTADASYESDLKLYEMEQELAKRDFIRVSKQAIINLRKIKSLKADINRKIRVTFVNDEQIVVSRMYADELRKRLGVK